MSEKNVKKDVKRQVKKNNGISEQLTIKVSGTTKVENGKYLFGICKVNDKDQCKSFG